LPKPRNVSSTATSLAVAVAPQPRPPARLQNLQPLHLLVGVQATLPLVLVAEEGARVATLVQVLKPEQLPVHVSSHLGPHQHHLLERQEQQHHHRPQHRLRLHLRLRLRRSKRLGQVQRNLGSMMYGGPRWLQLGTVVPVRCVTSAALLEPQAKLVPAVVFRLQHCASVAIHSMRMSLAIRLNPMHLVAACGADTLVAFALTLPTCPQAHGAPVATRAQITIRSHSTHVRWLAVHVRLTIMRVSAAVVTIGRATELMCGVIVSAMEIVLVLLGLQRRMSRSPDNLALRLWSLHRERLLQSGDRLQRIQADR